MTYYISCVTMDAAGTFIASVGVSAVIGPATEFITRAEVFRHMKKGHKFCTVYKIGGQWKLGAPVEPVQVGTEWFLRSDPNKAKADNLGALPSC